MAERNINNDIQFQITALTQHLERLMKQQQDEFHESEEQKVRLAAAEFSDYALIWWNKLQRERTRNEEPM
ncbi:hypothetical protein CR513_15079, partial [Mucuna pruriens]